MCFPFRLKLVRLGAGYTYCRVRSLIPDVVSCEDIGQETDFGLFFGGDAMICKEKDETSTKSCCSCYLPPSWWI